MNEQRRTQRSNLDIEYRVLLAAERVEAGVFNDAPNLLGGITVGVVLTGVHAGALSAVFSGIKCESYRAGYQPCALSHHEQEPMSSGDARSYWGTLDEGVESPLPPAFENTPAICVSRRSMTSWATSIEVDYELAAELALKHLADLGHRRIALVSGANELLNASSRRVSFFRVARTLGLEIYEYACLVPMNSNMRMGPVDEVLRDLFTQKRDITAICCSDTNVADLAFHAASDAGLLCPADLSIMSLDGVEGEESVGSCLTSVMQPLKRMGALATRVLLEQVHYPQAKFCRSILVQPKLAVRASTGPISFNRDQLGKSWVDSSLANC